jgi:hypothetical protein
LILIRIYARRLSWITRLSPYAAETVKDFVLNAARILTQVNVIVRKEPTCHYLNAGILKPAAESAALIGSLTVKN